MFLRGLAICIKLVHVCSFQGILKTLLLAPSNDQPQVTRSPSTDALKARGSLSPRQTIKRNVPKPILITLHASITFSKCFHGAAVAPKIAAPLPSIAPNILQVLAMPSGDKSHQGPNRTSISGLILPAIKSVMYACHHSFPSQTRSMLIAVFNIHSCVKSIDAGRAHGSCLKSRKY